MPQGCLARRVVAASSWTFWREDGSILALTPYKYIRLYCVYVDTKYVKSFDLVKMIAKTRSARQQF